MKALGLVEVYSFTTAVCVADIAAKTSDVKIIAFDRNRPISPDVPAPLVMVVKFEGDVAAVRAAVDASVEYAKAEGKYKGRKPVAVNEAKFRAVCARWRAGEITATAAMQEVGLKPNTFYRRVNELGV